MEISLEKIELVKDRTGVSYKEAKEALEKTEGNVVDAIILIEDSIDGESNETDSKVTELVGKIKEIVKSGNVSRIIVKKDDAIILNLPVNIGVIGTVVFPWAAVVSAVAAFGTKCEVKIIKVDGAEIDLSTKANDVLNVAKEKGGVIFDEVKDRGAEAFEYAKDKGQEAFEYAKDKGQDAWEFAKDKGADAFEVAKDKAADVINKVKKDDGVINVEDFGDLDLSGVDLNELEEDDE